MYYFAELILKLAHCAGIEPAKSMNGIEPSRRVCAKPGQPSLQWLNWLRTLESNQIKQWLTVTALSILGFCGIKLLTQTWDSYPSVSQMHSIGDKGQGHLTQYTLQRRWRCQHRLLFTLWLLLSTWFLVEQRGFEPLQNLLTSGLQPGTLPLRCLLH